MVINDKYKFIFVHVPKTGGTSISYALEKLKGNDNRFSEFDGGNDIRGLYKHCTLYEISKSNLLYFPFEEYFKFSFVRNPWGRIFSAFLWGNRNTSMDHNGKITTRSLTKWLDIKNLFKKYIFEKLDNNRPEEIQIKPQFDYFKINNSNGLDFIGRHENLEENFEKVKTQCLPEGVHTEPLLGLHNAFNHHPNLPTAFDKSSVFSLDGAEKLGEVLRQGGTVTYIRDYYKEYFDEETREAVADYYQKDIEEFNYTF